MIAKFAYLTTPAPGIFVLNIQVDGEPEIARFEISKAHLANILIDGTALALRDQGQSRATVELNGLMADAMGAAL